MKEPTLYIVATPIGTLGDMSPRAIEVLGQVDVIACEDTRHSGKLLHHFGVKTPMTSLHEHNEEQKALEIFENMKSGKAPWVGLITDAGTPGISDPGGRIVHLMHKNGIRVLSVPGPSSLAAALAASGILQPRCIFSQFLPRSSKEALQEIERWNKVRPCVAVFFESPQRIQSSLLLLLNAIEPEATVCVSREISKQFEEHVSGTLQEVATRFENSDKILGEFVVCISLPDNSEPISLEEALGQVRQLIESGVSLKEATKRVAEVSGHTAKTLYNGYQHLDV